jgi:hypothetical protein
MSQFSLFSKILPELSGTEMIEAQGHKGVHVKVARDYFLFFS